MSRTFLRSSSSRAIRPASIVLPRPTSSAMKRLTRGRRRAFCKRLKLVGVDADAGPEGGLEQVRVGGVTQFHRKRVQVGREELRWVETPRSRYHATRRP